MSAADASAPVAPAVYTVVRCRGDDGPAIWLQRLLLPVVAAVRFERAPPIELRGACAWGGFCLSLDYATDGRVSVSNQAPLRSRSALVGIYLHEAAHRLAWSRTGFHNAAFFALNFALLKRCDGLRLSPAAMSLGMSLYDLQDLPSELVETNDRGLGRTLSWAATVGEEMAGSSLSAEGMAAEIVRRYDAWIVELGDEPMRLTKQRKASQADLGSAHRLRGQVKFRGLVIGWLSLSLVSTVLLVLMARASG